MSEENTEGQGVATQQPQPEQAQQAPVAKKSGGGNKVLLIVVIIVVVLAVLGYFGMRFVGGYLSKKAGEKVAEGILSNALGGKVDVNSSGDGAKVTTDEGTVSVGDKATWPSDMPASVPKFAYGTINFATKVKATETSADTWSVMYEKVTDDALAKYEKDLGAKGWTKTQDAQLGFANTLMMENAPYSISVIYDPESKGLTMSVGSTTN